MGLEPVWKDNQTLLVSDGGPSRLKRTGASCGGRPPYVRAGREGSAVRKRWLIRNYESGELTRTYWGIGSVPERYGNHLPGYSRTLAHRPSAIRFVPHQWAKPEPAALS